MEVIQKMILTLGDFARDNNGINSKVYDYFLRIYMHFTSHKYEIERISNVREKECIS